MLERYNFCCFFPNFSFPHRPKIQLFFEPLDPVIGVALSPAQTGEYALVHHRAVAQLVHQIFSVVAKSFYGPEGMQSLSSEEKLFGLKL
jgi:hypothetical protein